MKAEGAGEMEGGIASSGWWEGSVQAAITKFIPSPSSPSWKNRKDGLHGPFSLEKELTTCIRPAPWIISMSKLASLNSFQYFCMADVKIYVMHFFLQLDCEYIM